MILNFIGKVCNYLRFNWIQILLVTLSIYDLRIDIRLLIDFFTFSTLFYTMFEHPLAITVLITIPSLFNSLKK